MASYPRHSLEHTGGFCGLVVKLFSPIGGELCPAFQMVQNGTIYLIVNLRRI